MADKDVPTFGEGGAGSNNQHLNLGPTLSTGSWGERGQDEVNVEQATAGFQDEVARQRSRQQHERTASRNSAAFAGGAGIDRVRSPLSRNQPTIAQQDSDLEAGEHEHRDQDGSNDNTEGERRASEDDFDLSKWILTRQAQEQQAGVDRHKPVGISFRNLSVRAPGTGSASVFVKTLPHALANTVIRDPFSVLSTLIPPFARLNPHTNTKDSHKLISDFSGLLKAGEMLLVLGRPGAGCSTFLRAMTTSLDPALTTEGTISYAGFTPADIARKFRGEVIFVDEDDLHFPTLTVAQTLRFALMNKVPKRSMRINHEKRHQFIETAIDVILSMFSIQHVRDTIVGDAFTRGVSGGERKRVTIGEALATRASCLAWDNSTRGLDASTALDYARSLRIMTDLSKRTTLATLYQVSESIFDLFDKVAVVDDGRLIYYGPRDQVRDYFYGLGYEIPARSTTADFCTVNVVDEKETVYRTDMPAGSPPAPRTAEERERAWQASDLYARLVREMDDYDEAVRASDKGEAVRLRETVRREKNKGVRKGSPYTVSFATQVQACIYRQLLVKWGAREDMYIKLFTIIGVSLIISSLFYQQSFDSSGTFTRGGIILFAGLLNGWLQLSESFEAVSGRPMLARHKQFAFYRPSAVVIARAIVDIPLLLVQCFLSSIILYFLSSLRVNAGAFWIFFVYVFLSAYNLTCLYRLFAAFSPTFNEAVRFSVLGLNILVIFLGYVIRRPQMNWMIFLSYIQGLSYAFEGLIANEFSYPIDCAPSQIVPFGEVRDVQYQTCALTGSKPGSIVVQGEDYLQTTFGYSRSHIGRNIGVVIAFCVLYLIPTVIASEIMNFGGSGGGVTVFARTKRAKAQLADASVVPKQDIEAASDQLKPSRAGSDVTRTGDDDTIAHADNKEKTPVAGFNSSQKGAAALHKHVPASERPIFTWSDINLQLPNGGRKLLQHVDGYVKPGTMTALMGASGAGKTTLMSVLSQRGAVGTITGEMLVDGKPLGPGFSKGTGLVLQGDIHLGTQTVREAIELSALLRQPQDIPREQKLADAQNAIELLELEDLQDAIIGVPGAGLGVERRKRVTIAVELAAKPDLLLFLDEPTSGLDSSGAAAICRLLRRLAEEEGQAILCTIHQPSSLLFESFDNVLLLQHGGRTCYMGPIGEHAGQDSEVVRRYFEANGAPECPPEANVAEYILEVVSGGKSRGIDWGDKWSGSKEAEGVRAHIAEIVEERKQKPAPEDPRSRREYAADPWTQLVEVTKRQFRDMWRDSSFTYGIIFSNVVTSFVAGGAFAHLGYSPTNYQDRIFVVILVMLNFPAIVNSFIAKSFELRMLYQMRESPSKVYAWPIFISSIVITSIPIAILASIIWFLPAFFIPYYTRASSVAGYFYLMIFTMQFFMIFFSLLLALSCPSPVTAANLLPFLLPVLFCANGVIVPHKVMREPWKSFVYYVNPITYYVRGQLANIFHDQPVVCDSEDLYMFNAPPGQSCDAYAGEWARGTGGYLVDQGNNLCGYCQYSRGDQYAEQADAYYNFKWPAWVIFLAFTIFNLGASYYLYWHFNVKGWALFPGKTWLFSLPGKAWRAVASRGKKGREEEVEEA
ncbi:ATP-binding cassette transporter snq2 [Tilletia horrida]|nr:ATP-binding cassette transporter snq2 [Tilletia horrida]